MLHLNDIFSSSSAPKWHVGSSESNTNLLLILLWIVVLQLHYNSCWSATRQNRVLWIINLNDYNELTVINKYHSTTPHQYVAFYLLKSDQTIFALIYEIREQNSYYLLVKYFIIFEKSLEFLQRTWFVGHFINDPSSPASVKLANVFFVGFNAK